MYSVVRNIFQRQMYRFSYTYLNKVRSELYGVVFIAILHNSLPFLTNIYFTVFLSHFNLLLYGFCTHLDDCLPLFTTKVPYCGCCPSILVNNALACFPLRSLSVKCMAFLLVPIFPGSQVPLGHRILHHMCVSTCIQTYIDTSKDAFEHPIL